MKLGTKINVLILVSGFLCVIVLLMCLSMFKAQQNTSRELLKIKAVMWSNKVSETKVIIQHLKYEQDSTFIYLDTVDMDTFLQSSEYTNLIGQLQTADSVQRIEVTN